LRLSTGDSIITFFISVLIYTPIKECKENKNEPSIGTAGGGMLHSIIMQDLDLPIVP
jgi:hypothetical protein